MVWIACVADNMGLRFGGRRCSRDKEVTKEILTRCSGRLCVNRSAGSLFPVGTVEAVDTPQGDFCYWESPVPEGVLPEKIVLYCWNRAYPADEFFAFPGGEAHWRLQEEGEFSGFSHEQITRRVYIRKEA